MEKISTPCANARGSSSNLRRSTAASTVFWDYGPLGAELKRNVKELWWSSMTRMRDDVVGLEATIIMHPQIWKASGHVDTFSDPMVDCKGCKKRFRADQIDPSNGTIYSTIPERHGLPGRSGKTPEEAYLARRDRGPSRSRYWLHREAARIRTQNCDQILRPVRNQNSRVNRRDGSSDRVGQPALSGVRFPAFRNPSRFNLMFKTYVRPDGHGGRRGIPPS